MGQSAIQWPKNAFLKDTGVACVYIAYVVSAAFSKDSVIYLPVCLNDRIFDNGSNYKTSRKLSCTAIVMDLLGFAAIRYELTAMESKDLRNFRIIENP